MLRLAQMHRLHQRHREKREAANVQAMLCDPEVRSLLEAHIAKKQAASQRMSLPPEELMSNPPTPQSSVNGEAPQTKRFQDPYQDPYPVERCARPADLPGKETLGIEHWWLKSPDFEAGMGPANGGVPGHGGKDSPFVSKTTINDHRGEAHDPKAHCEPAGQLNQGWAYEDQKCLLEVMRIGRDTGRWRPTNQCHTVIQEALDKCALPPPDPGPLDAGVPGGVKEE